jgi:hypothetical protein
MKADPTDVLRNERRVTGFSCMSISHEEHISAVCCLNLSSPKGSSNYSHVRSIANSSVELTLPLIVGYSIPAGILLTLWARVTEHTNQGQVKRKNLDKLKTTGTQVEVAIGHGRSKR